MTRVPGFLQDIMLLLPIRLAVMGVSLLTTFVPMINQHFKAVRIMMPLPVPVMTATLPFSRLESSTQAALFFP